MSDAPESQSSQPEPQPELPAQLPSRSVMRRLREAVREPYVPYQPRHRMTLRSLEPAEDLGPFASSVDDVYQVPADLEPWTPGEDDEVPWELREDPPAR